MNPFSIIKKYGLMIIILVVSYGVHAQGTIQVLALDSIEQSPIDHVQLELYNMGNNQLLDYGYTDETGSYTFEVNEGAYYVKAKNLSYHTQRIDIILLAQQSKTTTVELTLQRKENILDEIKIEARKEGILIKEDTVVYDVATYLQNADESVQDVISRMPGLKVNANGEIEYKNQAIDHVLIDGQKVSDVGDGAITQNITADMVESIEIRTKEENVALKKSLLDSRDVLVLDIKLKSQVKKDIFGKIEATAGSNPDLVGGGYISLFSLTDKRNIHLLAEHDPLGSPNIDLANLQNLGREALATIFEIPADYQRLTEKQEFSNEIFGFESLANQESSTATISSNWKLADHWTLYMGSYLHHKNQLFEQTTLQESGEEIFAFNLSDNNQPLDWKNKIILDYSAEDTKFNYELNSVHVNGSSQNLINTTSTQQYSFENDPRNWEIYQSLQYEKKLSSALGLGIYGMYSRYDLAQRLGLNHNDSSYVEIIEDLDNTLDIDQSINEIQNSFHAAIQFSSQVLGHDVSWGYRHFTEWNEVEKQSNINSFTGSGNGRFIKNEFFVNNTLFLGPALWENKIGFARYQFEDRTDLYNSISPFRLNFSSELRAGVTSDISLMLQYSNQVGAMPYRHFSSGLELINFNTIGSPQQIPLVELPENTVFSMGFDYTGLKRFGYEVSYNFILGAVNNSPNFTIAYFPIANLQYAQLPQSYTLQVFQVNKRFEKLPVRSLLELGTMTNETNIIETNDGSRTRRFIINLELTTESQKAYNLFAKLGWRKYIFDNIDNSASQYMTLVELNHSYRLAQKHRLTLATKYGNISGTQSTENFITSMSYQYIMPQYALQLGIHNVLDNDRFNVVDINPIFETNTETAMLGRYFYVKASFRFGAQ